MASSKGGISDDLVAVLDRNLAGEQRAAAGTAVVENFREIVSSLTQEGSEPPVVEEGNPSVASRWMSFPKDPFARARVNSSSGRETR